MTDKIIRELPSAVYIRERLDYDPETGVFVWRWCEAMRVQWNARYAGTVAGADHPHGYRQIRIDGRKHLAHRMAWVIATGEWPDADIDHISGIKTDNRLSNLRAVSHAENQRNQAVPKNNTSGTVGVCWDKALGKWHARIKADGRHIHLGYFTGLADAVAARKAAEITYGFHANHGRVALSRKAG